MRAIEDYIASHQPASSKNIASLQEQLNAYKNSPTEIKKAAFLEKESVGDAKADDFTVAMFEDNDVIKLDINDTGIEKGYTKDHPFNNSWEIVIDKETGIASLYMKRINSKDPKDDKVTGAYTVTTDGNVTTRGDFAKGDVESMINRVQSAM